MKVTWKDAVQRQRMMLAERLSLPLESLATNCEAVWENRDALGKVLLNNFETISL